MTHPIPALDHPDMTDAPPFYEDPWFRLVPSRDCPLPGYLVLLAKEEPRSLAELSIEAAASLGPLMVRATRAIEKAVKPERVYCALFSEAHARVHFHLVPRTAALGAAFRQAKDWQGDCLSGPALMDWLREAPPARDEAELARVAAAIREELERS